MDSVTLILVFAILLLAGVVKGVTAMGLPTLGMGLLSLVMPPVEAAAVMVLPAVLTNVVQLVTGPRLLLVVRRFWLLGLAAIAGTLVGGRWLGGLTSHLAPGILGATLLLYGLLGLSKVQLHTPPAWEPWLSPVTGLVSGFLTGTTGVTVMPAAPYLQSLGLDREDLVQAMGLAFTLSTFALAASLACAGGPLSEPHMALGSIAALVPAFLGMELGRRVRMRISQAGFRTCFFACLAFLGVHMLIRAIAF